MQMKDLQQKTPEDLRHLLDEKREALRAFRFGTSGSKTRDVKAGRNLKGDIARILTLLRRTTP